MITYVKGDLLARKRIAIAHVVNNEGKWGAGFSGALSSRWPLLEGQYKTFIQQHRGDPLGSCSPYTVGEGVTVIHMCAMNGVYHSRTNPRPLNYEALDKCLSWVAKFCYVMKVDTVKMPRIGAGLARGEWSRIEPLINKNLADKEVIIYTL